jgi:hypothetical protein
MILAAVRPFARLVTDWCLSQDDLAGFRIEAGETSDCVRVVLEWPNGWRSWRTFSLRELESPGATRFVIDVLESFAAEARKRAARIADPGRLPG